MLPDGKPLTIGNQRFRAGEYLFKPHLNGKEDPGISNLTFKSINKCDIDVRKDLYENIILSGGTSWFVGLP